MEAGANVFPSDSVESIEEITQPWRKFDDLMIKSTHTHIHTQACHQIVTLLACVSMSLSIWHLKWCKIPNGNKTRNRGYCDPVTIKTSAQWGRCKCYIRRRSTCFAIAHRSRRRGTDSDATWATMRQKSIPNFRSTHGRPVSQHIHHCALLTGCGAVRTRRCTRPHTSR